MCAISLCLHHFLASHAHSRQLLCLTVQLLQANTSEPALVQSVSVGTTEYEYAEAMGAKFVHRINQEFMKVCRTYVYVCVT